MNKRLKKALSQLGPEEIEVMIILAERLLEGQRRYGQIKLGSDDRDWKKEQDEESQDLLIYAAFNSLKKRP